MNKKSAAIAADWEFDGGHKSRHYCDYDVVFEPYHSSGGSCGRH
ncbi:MAG TPA: hypothetical protein VKR42_03330 [Ktedonobacteraceae bacterium]|nr:hypothetical protein [Ktedonobacteraceae bacterium]